MAKITFAVDARTKLGSSNAKRLRKERIIPGIVTGLGKEAISIQADFIGIERLYYTAGESTLINLNIDGGETVEVLIHDIDFHPLTNEVSHIEFLRIDPQKPIHTSIPFVFTGVSSAAKLGGLFIINRDHIEVICLPKDLVHDIKIPLESLTEIGMNISIKDVQFPEGIVSEIPGDVVVAHVEEPRKAEIIEEVAEEVVEEGAEEKIEEGAEDKKEA